MSNIGNGQTDRDTTLLNCTYVRLSQIIHPRGPLPISKSSWWEGVRARRYPQPIKLGKRITAWRASDIYALIERGVQS